MKTKMVIIFIIVGILLIGAIGCTTVEGAPNGQKDTQKSYEFTIDEFTNTAHITRAIEINKGETLQLTLGSNPTTGFKWSDQAQISDQSILEQTQHQYLDPAAQDGQPVLGGAGKEVWTFKSLKAGASDITMSYSRQWEGGEKGIWTLILTVTVK